MTRVKPTGGFSLLELLLALTVFSVISVVSVYLLFSSLSLRDETVASANTQEAIRVFLHAFAAATTNARTVNVTGNGLFTSNPSDCWSFVWNSGSETLNYSHLTTPGCTPDVSPGTSFLPSNVKAENVSFTAKPLSTGGREISLSATFAGFAPLSESRTSFTNTVVNLVD